MNQVPRRVMPSNDVGNLKSRIRVYVDGDMLRHIVGYDCDEGWVMVMDHDDDGRLIRDGEEYICRRVWGEVKAVMAR